MVATSSSAESISDTVSSPSNVLSSIARTLKHRMDPDVVVGTKVTDPSVIVISEESSYEGMKHTGKVAYHTHTVMWVLAMIPLYY